MKKLYFAFAALAGALAGCMSMDDMLASDNKIWREMGESRAVTYATETGGEQTLEQRLAVIPKIRDQQKLAKIYIAPGALPEVKKAAREKLTEVDAFIYVVLNSTDQAQRKDAMKQCAGTDANRIAAAWRFALERPSSTIAGSLLKGVKDPTLIAEAAAARIDEMTALSDDIETMRRNYGDGPFVEAKQKQLLALIGGVQKFAPYVQDEERLAAWIARADIAETRGTQIDLYTPFATAYQKVVQERIFASLNDEERRELLEGEGVVHLREVAFILDTTLAKIRKSAQAAREPMARGRASIEIPEMATSAKEPEYDVLVKEAELVASFKDKALAGSILAERRKRAEMKLARERADAAASRIMNMPPDKQNAEIAKIADPNERKEAVFKIIDSLRAVGKVTPSHKEMLQTIPAKDLAARLRLAAKEMKGNVQQYRASGPAAAFAIKDQAVIKDLLLDDPSWAYEMGLDEDFGVAYTALLENCTDDDTLENVFREAKPDEHDRIVTAWELRNVFKYMSPERRAKLLAEAKNRSADAAKTNVVVKGLYLGMGLGDYCLIRAEADAPCSAKWDGNERLTYIYFGKDGRDSFLDVGKGIDGVTKFKELYCKVPDGVDLAKNSRSEISTVVRSIKHLNSQAKGQYDRYRWEYSHFAKYVDTVHAFQVEIQDETGNLTIRRPVDESVIGVEDKTKEEEQDLLSIF